MNVKEAIAIAKKYVGEVYAEEEVSNVGLEETEYDDSFESWHITLGFSRPWNTPRTQSQALLDTIGATDNAGNTTSRKRSYKIIIVSKDGSVLSMKNRQTADADG